MFSIIDFLTEKSKSRLYKSIKIRVGWRSNDISIVSKLFRERFGSTISIIETNYESIRLYLVIKYMTNTFFSKRRFSFLNDMKILSDESGNRWEDVIEGFVRDGRVGHSHLNMYVVGHDGKYGFGGSCFPKDIHAQ